jgi:hypothetical protein
MYFHTVSRWTGTRLLVATALAGSTIAFAALPLGNTVQQWNKIAEDAVLGAGAVQNEGLLYMSYASLAVYDALVAIEGGYEPYAAAIAAPPGASAEAATIEAAYRVLRHYLPSQAATLDAFYNEALAAIGDSSAKVDGMVVGATAAATIIELRSNDGRMTPIGTTSPVNPPPPGPGVYRLTPPYPSLQTPWLGDVQPFVLKHAGQFHPPQPPPLSSNRWVEAFDEVKRLGQNSSGERTVDQTAVARFWTANVLRQYNRLGREVATAQGLNLVETARLLAMINVVAADAQISVFYSKFAFFFWRPVTAIDPTSVIPDGFGLQAYDDGNPRTAEEPGWRPLLVTPNHPEYPSAHGSITSAIAEALATFLGTEQIDLDIHGFDAAGAPGNFDATRHFATAEHLRSEIANARVWSGLHYRFATEAGIALGTKVAHYVLNHAFKPVQ